MKPFIYLRALRHAEHTVLCVEDGQKTYFDPQFGRNLPYSSGQQVKRSVLQYVLDELNAPMAPVTFNYNITKLTRKLLSRLNTYINKMLV